MAAQTTSIPQPNRELEKSSFFISFTTWEDRAQTIESTAITFCKPSARNSLLITIFSVFHHVSSTSGAHTAMSGSELKEERHLSTRLPQFSLQVSATINNKASAVMFSIAHRNFGPKYDCEGN
jgi:hypothetical protein